MTAIYPARASTYSDILPARTGAAPLRENAPMAEADDTGANARARLQRIKDQLEFLKRWRFPPQITLQQAAQRARELGSAARAFAEGAGSQSATPMTASSALFGYGEALQDATEATPLSAQDRSTAEDFIGTARQLKLVMEQARRKMQQEKAEASRQGAGDATGPESGVVALQQMLDNAPAASFTGLASVLPSL